VAPAPITTVFDHKFVDLTLGCVKKNVNRDIIKNQIVKNPWVSYAVQATILEFHLQNADSASFPPYEKNRLLLDLGRIFHRINEHSTANLTRIENGEPLVNETDMLNEIGEIFETGILEYFENIEKSRSPDVFFESLTLVIKNTVLSEQHKIYTVKNAKKNG
jgi:hypothetical protein